MAGENGWRECIVGDVAAAQKNALVGGPFGSNLVKRDYTPTGVPVIRGQNLSVGQWVGGECVFVSDDKADSLSANLARPGDLVFTQRGNAVLNGGQVAIVPDDVHERYVVSQSQMKLTVDPAKADVTFLYYVFKSPNHEAYLRNNAIVTGVPHTNLGLLRDYPLRLPPLSEQQAIAEILGALDAKIELNRRMNETLESLARCVFKSWFVDFDPVRRNCEGGSVKSETSDTSPFSLHSSNFDHLFPNSFEHAAGELIPRGWVKTTLGEEVDFQTGFAFKSKFFTENPPGIRLARGMNVKEGEFFWRSQARYWPEVTPDIEEYLLQSGDVLIGMDGSKVGKNWVRVRAADLPCLLVQRVARLRAASSIGENFIWILVGDTTFRYFVDAVKTGTSIPHISGGQIKSYDFIRPPRDDNRIFGHFESLVAPMTEQADKNHAESETLAALRDTLLPKLLSGEVRIVKGEE